MAATDTDAPKVRASARYVRIAPRKARVVADQIRGLDVEQALALLRFSPRGAAVTLRKVVESAAANAENNFDLDPEEMKITEISIDEGPTMRRYRAPRKGPGDPHRQANLPHQRGPHTHSGRRLGRPALLMGQKINPEGFRVGYIHDWKSNWFDERELLRCPDRGRQDPRSHRDEAGARRPLRHRDPQAARRGHRRHPHRPPRHRDRQVRFRGRRAAQGAAQDHRQAGPRQHQGDQASRARREAGRSVDRRAARGSRCLPPRDEARADLRDALRRQGSQGPGLRPPRRRRDGPHRGLLGRPRAAPHTSR